MVALEDVSFDAILVPPPFAALPFASPPPTAGGLGFGRGRGRFGAVLTCTTVAEMSEGSATCGPAL